MGFRWTTSSSSSSRAAFRLRAVWIVGVLCVSLGLSHVALAQEDAEAQYKQLIQQALGEFRRQNWPEARVLFRRAHALSPNARTLRGMGVVLEDKDGKTIWRRG